MDSEQRHSTRKALKANGRLLLDASPPLEMRTINVASDGMAIAAREPVVEGAHYRVHFDVTVDGTAYQVAAGAKVVFCVYAGQSEFKAGLRFVELDQRSTAAIAGFLGH
ncbi:MAG: PilZ domain-containing protein [Herminiimonas sp.]|nr:PilZ domain-containing protein [Herminiimonas sp.]